MLTYQVVVSKLEQVRHIQRVTFSPSTMVANENIIIKIDNKLTLGYAKLRYLKNIQLAYLIQKLKC